MKTSKSPKLSTNPKRELTRIAMRYRLSAIFAFGSRSADAEAIINGKRCSGEYPSSDIDVGVLPLQGVKMGPREKVRLTMELEDLLRVKNVDLVVLPEADPFLAANVIRGERIYCDDEYAVDEYGLYILRRAGDLIPLEEERISLIMGGN
jgi:predicted nucleotidyltransferase